MSRLQISCTNFRKLRDFSWAPAPFSALVGPNGAGKTTVLDMLGFLRATFALGHEAGFRAAGGGDHFPSRGASAEDMVVFDVRVQDIRWRLRLPMSAAGLKGRFGEELYQGNKVILRAAAYGEVWHLGKKALPFDETRCCARVLWDRGESPWMQPLFDALGELRTFQFNLDAVRDGTTREDAASFLHKQGHNLWAVLASWKQAPMRFRGQFEWVMQQARLAFPDLVNTIEFAQHEASIFPPGATDPADGLPPRRQPDGLLTGLLLLTAVAGAKPGSLVAFDEVENQLHPHAIRAILHAMRTLAEERDLTVVLTTHSPVVLNCFRDEPESVFVLNHGQAGVPNPGPMSALHSEEWLAQSKLGTLYERMAFGAPDLRLPKP